MFDLTGPIGTIVNFLVIAIGFGLIIFIHELGHFLAAKWAGIRVLAFSIGFGQIVCSYRKGIGFKRGSSEPEYLKRAYGLSAEETQKLHNEISPTEYRFSLLPLGGYVKMLGQEDLNPDATSSEPDSYQNCSVPKRMVVISAGVIMNVVSAALLFIIVFNAGLRVFPAQAGYIVPDGPAAMATPITHPELGEGLQRGDVITQINGKKMYSFEHILPEIAMSRKGEPVSITVKREGVTGPIEFSATPIKNPATGLLDIQMNPPISPVIQTTRVANDQRVVDLFAANMGLGQVEGGDTLVSVGAKPVHSPLDLLDLAEQSQGQPFPVEIKRADATRTVSIQPVRALELGIYNSDDGQRLLNHVLGLRGVMMINPDAQTQDTKQGLLPGDIFARLGSKPYPSIDEGLNLVRSSAGQKLPLTVLRGTPESGYERVNLEVQVTPEGTIGFYPIESSLYASFVHEPINIAPLDEHEFRTDPNYQPIPVQTPASRLIEYPGSRIASIAGTRIDTLGDIVGAVVDATQQAFDRGDDSFAVEVVLELPLPRQPDGSMPTTTVQWDLTRAEIEPLRDLGWTLPGADAISMVFMPDQVIDRAKSPLAAIERGIAESQRVMKQTYLTFLRLFEGSVQVRHLKGPVGIAHLGTQIASQGFIWVLFFMALISINLAVINFLPLPIVDGGQFLMLCYEWIRGKPVPIMVQNIATMAGLLFIGAMFLYVTFNDIKTILGV